MDTEPARKPRRVRWLNPTTVMVVGVVVIVCMLGWPITIGSPGDHETATCGSAFSMDLRRWQGVGAESPEHRAEMARYYEAAYRSCMAGRVDRLARTLGVLTIFVAIVVVLFQRERAVGPPPAGPDAVAPG